MAAIRSALVMLGRRSRGSSGFSATASLGGRGLQIHQVFGQAASRTLSLRPAFRGLEGSRHFSTEGRESMDKAEGVLRMWWKRCTNMDVLTMTQCLTLYLGVFWVTMAYLKLNGKLTPHPPKYDLTKIASASSQSHCLDDSIYLE